MKKKMQQETKFFFNMFSDRENFIDKLNGLNILVIGCGTIGSSVINTLSKLGIKNFDIIDNDKITRHSIESQFTYRNKDINKKKGEVLKDIILENSIESKVHFFDIRVEKVNDIAGLFVHKKYDYVIDCFDEKNLQLQCDLLFF